MAKLKYLVIHCTATPEGREVSSADIRKWHTSPVCRGGRGWKQVGYTDLFHLNGGVERLVRQQRGRRGGPLGSDQRSQRLQQFEPSYRICRGSVRGRKTPKDTRTACQKKALEKYVKDFHRRFPNVRIVGHNELAAKACPSFDVQKWLKEIGINQ